MKENITGLWRVVYRTWGRRPVLTACTLSALVIVALGAWMVRRTAAETVSSETVTDAAWDETLETVLNNAGCPNDPDRLQATVVVAFGFLHPEMASGSQPQDPASVQERAAAASTFLNPWAYEAELMKDSAANQRRDDAFRTLTQGLRR
jgi:hypothetical protein